MSTGDEIQGIPSAEEYDEKPLWGIEAISRLTHWIDEFTMANSAIIMMAAVLAIGADALMNGALFSGNNGALTIIGVITALGIETQARTMLRRGKIAWDNNRSGTAIFWWLVTAPIVAMLFQTVWMWFLERTQSVTEAQALAEIGISYYFFTLERAAIFVFLFVMSGVNYYIRHKARKRAHKDVKQDMLDEIDLAPVQAKLAQARALVDAANVQRVRGAGAALFRGDYGRLAQQDDDEFAPAAAYSVAPISYAPVPQPQPPVALVPYRGGKASVVNGGDDTLPPSGGNGGRGKRPVGRPRVTVNQMLTTTPPTSLERASNSGKLKAQREEAVGFLQGWLLGMSQAIARGEMVEQPTSVDAHEYLKGMNLAPKAVATSRAWLNIAIANLRNNGVTIDWSHPAMAANG